MGKTCAALEIGPTACWLVALVVSQEDKCRYSKPIAFFNDQLAALAGVSKPATLRRAREAAVDAGWLVYIPSKKGSKKPGRYWSDIPPEHRKIDDAEFCEPAIDEDSYGLGYATGYDDAKQGKPRRSHGTQNGHREDSHGTQNGHRRGHRRGHLSNLSPNPSSCRDTEASDGSTSSKNKRKPTFSTEDKAFAEWMWQTILKIQPNRKPPNLDKWANDVRLMREIDERTDTEMRELYRRVNAHTFWRTNVLSPSKLREKWDDLQLKLNGSANVGAHPTVDDLYKETTPC